MMDKSVHPQFEAIKLDQLVYVELQARNGGMMLTVSEEGFTFRAVTSVRPSGRIPFSFIIHGNEKLEGYGEIKWTKDDGKVAGLQFTDISTEFLNALRKWLAEFSAPDVRSSAKARTDNAFDLDHSSRMESPETSAPEQLVENGLRREFGLNFGQSLSSGMPQNYATQASASDTSTPVLPRSTHILTDWEYPDGVPPPRSQGNGVVIAAVVACFLLLAVLLYSFREPIGRSLISLGQKISAPSESSQAQSADASKPAEEVQRPAPATSGKPDNPVSSGADKSPQTQAPTTTGGDKSEDVQPPANRQKAAAPPPNVEPQFRDERPAPSAEEAPARNARSQIPAEDARTLWSAVGQGNTSAEVTLAKLYLIGGGGVPKNCDQARVLLRAAAKKGNGEAIAKLSQITRQGCP